ncbi:Ribosomal N-lysine methyltransferase 4 [Escovopsis weberi]|uniref:Ribosomal N-lysine methyltransferase 4 n=1 Tax=Escovopsis weberi TaxID=150374 RepID=A0A0M9VRT6_ESCWE|nr:Ribosomal N-lysine methyltransferase 4 [Escovopsis weberi]
MRLSPASIRANPPTTSDEDAHFHAQTDEFFKWFIGFPGTTFSDSLNIVDLRSRNAGRGIMATQDVPADTVLFTIPRSMILNPDTFALREPQGKILRAFKDEHGGPEGQPSPWPLMIMILMSEFFQDQRSRFLPYIEVLPGAFETPMFWTEEELAQLQASPTRSKIGKDAAEHMFREKIVPFIRKHEHGFEGSERWSDEELVSLAHRMGSTLMSYAFDFDRDAEPERDEDEEWEEDAEHEAQSTMGMVPMADILNADAEFNAHVVHEPDCLTVTSVRTIKAGEEVLNYYGPHPNSELLRRYGYVTPKHSRYDVVELPWSTIEAAVSTVLSLSPEQTSKAHEYMASKFEDEGAELEDVFVLERQYDDPNPDGTFPGPACFTGAPEELDEQLKMFLKAVRKTDASPAPEKRKREHVQAAVMLRALEDTEAAYATSAMEDEQLLLAGGRDLPARLGMAVAVRLGEKELIREAREYYYAAVDGDGDVDMDGDEGNHKRARRG